MSDSFVKPVNPTDAGCILSRESRPEKSYFIKEENFNNFISLMTQKKKIVAPTLKKGGKQQKFTFSHLKNADDLRLDYDVTILPPKKEIFPPRQPLLKFDGNKYESCVNPEEKVLFGVHFYDMKAIEKLDFLFSEDNKDINYLANRAALTIVCSNIQNINPRAFFGSVGNGFVINGQDAFITKISKGYLYQTYTNRGEDLLQFGEFSDATDEQITECTKINMDVLDSCKEKLIGTSEEIAQKVRASFANNKFWETESQDCFSCGTCNIVCPTCYCFNIEDRWNLDQVTGDRTRTWDGCQLEDFAKISLGGGATENFRETRGSRYRHRIMRKAAYLNKKLGAPACVGCGRCSLSCTSDIADPVKVINKIMEAK